MDQLRLITFIALGAILQGGFILGRRFFDLDNVITFLKTLGVSLVGFVPDKRQREYIFATHDLMAVLTFMGAFAFFFRKTILPILCRFPSPATEVD